MKIRACKEVFYSKMTEDELLSQILNDMESPEYPQIISNNECSVTIGEEKTNDDSPLSFLVKFKASFVSPSAIPNGLAGIIIPEGPKNKKHNDDESFFESINKNHYNLELTDEDEAQKLIDEIREVEESNFIFSLEQIKDYLTQNSASSEWNQFYQQNNKWEKFFKNLMVKNFEEKHCSLKFEDINEYKKQNPDGFEDDLKFLINSGYLVNDKKKKAVRKYFPDLIP